MLSLGYARNSVSAVIRCRTILSVAVQSGTVLCVENGRQMSTFEDTYPEWVLASLPDIEVGNKAVCATCGKDHTVKPFSCCDCHAQSPEVMVVEHDGGERQIVGYKGKFICLYVPPDREDPPCWMLDGTWEGEDEQPTD